MRKQNIKRILCAIFMMVTASAAQQTSVTKFSESGNTQRRSASSAYGKLPLAFEANLGQTAAPAKFVARGNGYSAFLTNGGMVLAMRPSNIVGAQPAANPASPAISREQVRSTLYFNLLGTNPNPVAVGEDEQPGRVNYFIGKDPKRWRHNIPTYAKVRYKNVYPGIDLVYYGNQRQLEYDFEVSTKADPNLIQFEIKGANGLQLAENGDLILTMNGGELHFKSPVVYQQSKRQRSPVEGGYIIKDATHIGFHLAHYDSSKPLVIDPVLVYSTYMGGSGDDEPHAIAIDNTGSIYVAGDTDSSDFPNTNIFAGPLGPLDFGIAHTFVAKLDPTGSTLVYADYLGGDGGDWGSALVLDGANEVYVTGTTTSDDFPTVNPYQASQPGIRNAFLSKLSADGSQLLYSTYLGGNDWDTPSGVAIDGLGEVYVAGWTSSTNFPVLNAYQPTVSADQDGVYGSYGFVTKFNPDGQSLVYSTYLGGSLMPTQTCWNGPCVLPPFSGVWGLALDASGNAYVGGTTSTLDFPATAGAYLTTNSNLQGLPVGFVSKFDASGGLSYSTYLYGPGGAETNIKAITVDSLGSAYIAGATSSDGTFPITSTSICNPGVYGQGCSYTFASKLDPLGATLLYSTFLGPNNNASPQAIALDANNDAYILGMTWGCNSFAMVGGIESCGDVATSDLLLVEIDPTASTELFATFLGGSDDEYPAGLVVDSAGNIYIGGETFSSDFPTTQGVFQNVLKGASNAFLLKIAPGSAAAFSASPFLLQYSSQQVGSTSPAATVLVRNEGSAPLSMSSITVAGDFAQTNDCGFTVAAAGTCTFSLTFSPTGAGTRPGTIVIADNAAGSPHKINLIGVAPGPVATLSDGSLTFSAQAVGVPTAAQAVTVTNTGDEAFAISNIQVSGDFGQTNNCPTALAANSSCSVNLTFTPTDAGVRNGSLTISDNAEAGGQAVNLTGAGVDFTLTGPQRGNAVDAGGTAGYQFAISPVGGAFNSPIQLSCSATPLANCKVSPSTITPNGGPVTATLTLSAVVSSSQANRVQGLQGHPIYAVWMELQGVGLLGLVLFGRKRRSKGLAAAVLLVVVVAGVGFMSGCGGAAGTRQTQTGIAPENYAITIKGTSGTVTHAFPLTLNVQ